MTLYPPGNGGRGVECEPGCDLCKRATHKQQGYITMGEWCHPPDPTTAPPHPPNTSRVVDALNAACDRAEAWAASGNRKTTEGKTPYEALPLPELAGVAKVFAYGNAKYGEENWRLPLPGTDDTIGKYYAACLRHLAECWDDADARDAESDLLHIDHAIASLLIARSQMDGI